MTTLLSSDRIREAIDTQRLRVADLLDQLLADLSFVWTSTHDEQAKVDIGGVTSTGLYGTLGG
jgi:hypothetical protein